MQLLSKCLDTNNLRIYDWLFFRYSSLKNISIAWAMQRFFALSSEKTPLEMKNK